jgi:hypothetical protein
MNGWDQKLLRSAMLWALALAGLWGPGTAQADDVDRQRVYRSAHFLGRGDTGIAHADNEDAVFYNPAGIAQGKGIYKRTVLASPHTEFSQATRDLVRQLAFEDADAVDTVKQNIGKSNHASAQNFSGVVLRRAALGAFASASVDMLAFKDPDRGGLETVQASVVENAGVTFSLAESFGKGEYLFGVTGKYMQRGIGEVEASVLDAQTAKDQVQDSEDLVNQGTGGGADLGFMWMPKGRSNPTMGLTVENAGGTNIIPEQESAIDLDLKQTVNVGFSVSPGTRFSTFRLLLDYRDATNAIQDNVRKKIHLGSELTVQDYVGFTAGLNQGGNTFGLYTDLYFFRFDAGMYTQEVSERVGKRSDRRYFVQLRVGF